MNKKIFDMFGHEILLEDYFVYPGMYADSTQMRIGKLIEIKTKKNHLKKEYLIASIVATDTSKYSDIDRIGIKCFDKMVRLGNLCQREKAIEIFKSKKNFKDYEKYF